ncbi:FMN-dependent NADH-azoreductase [Staphylococcus aureus]|uniref:FMN-dependent NADH-azoreductase n=1 Tax=Staphylococcus aureus TaxID=1280 RepID=A0A380DNX3_STAAU|nr:FMN-dependent NADH-azoreductase [Staphylococcus aureus]
MWNLSFPPVVKAYIDAISIAGKTFKYSAEGPQGLLTDKKVLHIQSRGGYYTEGPAANFEMGDRYLRTIMTFLGVPSYETIIMKDTMPNRIKLKKLKQLVLIMLKNWQQHFNCYLHCVTNQTSYSVFLIFLQSFSTFIYIYCFYKFKF